ncbi:MAG TPA: FAD-dependent oxidoreductase [Clostridiales bacterium]|jgi:hypothetical protein|nr:FAD-dependent oxidoreductase [Clostridiales bacterium]
MKTKKVFEPKRIDGSFDVLVAGGGLAGVMAAVAAAREGASVILIEKYGFLGGMATCGLVHPFMDWRERGSWKSVNTGLFDDMRRRVFELGGSGAPDSGMYQEEFMKLALDRMVGEYPSIKLLLHSRLASVESCDNEIKSVTVSTVSGLINLSAKIYIDCTGNGDLSAFGGFEYEQGREEDGLCQPMTLNFRLANVRWEDIDLPAMQQLYKEFRVEGKIKNPRENVLIFRMPYKQLMHLNTTRIVGRDPVDVEDYTAGELEAREQVYEMYRFMKDNIRGMENCELIMSAPELGIRESRRIVGEYRITEDDILGVRKFDDRIARGTYDIDIHNPSGTGTYIKQIPENDYYTIPYRAIIPARSKNLLVAGRPISSTHAAHSSFRIMPITSCIGEAAGVAAYLAAKNCCAPRDIDVSKMQEMLTERGALV